MGETEVIKMCEKEKGLYNLSFELAKKGIDAEELFKMIEDILTSEAVKKLINLTNKNYIYLLKKTGFEKAGKREIERLEKRLKELRGDDSAF